MFPAPRHQRLRWVLTLGTLLAFQAAGWYSFWGVLVIDARISAAQIISSEKILQRLTLPAADLAQYWVKQGEIRFQGHLYDVRRQWLQGDSVCLEVYHDQREEALYRTLHTLLSGDHSPTTPLRNWLLQWMSSMYVLPSVAVLPQWSAWYVVVPCPYPRMVAQHRPAQPGPPPKGRRSL